MDKNKTEELVIAKIWLSVTSEGIAEVWNNDYEEFKEQYYGCFKALRTTHSTSLRNGIDLISSLSASAVRSSPAIYYLMSTTWARSLSLRSLTQRIQMMRRSTSSTHRSTMTA